jgi:hypothetical protein
LLKLLDDTPVVPGDSRQTYNGSQYAQQILRDAEDDMRDWTFNEAEVEGGAQRTGSGMVEDEDAKIVSTNARAATANENVTIDTPATLSPQGTPVMSGGRGGHRGTATDRTSEATLSEPGPAITADKSQIAEVGA